MLRRFESLLDPTAPAPDSPPVAGLLRFYWHFIHQARWLTAGLFLGGGVIAMLDASIPAFIGRVVSLVSMHAPATLWQDAWPQLTAMAAVLLLARPAAMLWQNVMINQVVNPGLSNMIRWQNHWHVVRQSWTFFQNDFAGRIANRVLQTGPALRESLVMTFDAAWYIVVYGSSAVALLAASDWRLALPILVWFGCYAGMLRWFVPRLRDRSRRVSEMRSNLTGRVVDSYTNILTVKLFARARDEDAWVRDAVDDHTTAFRDQTRMITGYTMTLIDDERAAAGEHRERGASGSGRGAHRGRHGGDGDAAGVADRQHRRLGGAQRHRDLREYRHGAGRHALDRCAPADAGSAGRHRVAGDRRRDPFRPPAFRLRSSGTAS